MANIVLLQMHACETCGGTGFAGCMVTCNVCSSSTVHRYCLDEIKEGCIKITWDCEQCQMKHHGHASSVFGKDEKSLKSGDTVDIVESIHHGRASSVFGKDETSLKTGDTVDIVESIHHGHASSVFGKDEKSLKTGDTVDIVESIRKDVGRKRGVKRKRRKPG